MTVGWRVLAGGCHLNRDTMATVKSVGFEAEEEQKGLDGWFVYARLKKS